MFLYSVDIRDNTHELMHAVVKSLGIPWALSTLAPGLPTGSIKIVQEVTVQLPYHTLS
jgi:hypothetical protein